MKWNEMKWNEMKWNEMKRFRKVKAKGNRRRIMEGWLFIMEMMGVIVALSMVFPFCIFHDLWAPSASGRRADKPCTSTILFLHVIPSFLPSFLPSFHWFNWSDWNVPNYCILASFYYHCVLEFMMLDLNFDCKFWLGF